MKKIFLFAALAVIFAITSCNDTKSEKTTAETMLTDKKENAMAEKNLAASHIINKAFESGDASAIDNAVASNFVDHTDQGDKNRDSLKAMITVMKKEFPDMKMEMIKELADNDYVFSLIRWTGTSNGQMGMPKGPYDMKAIEVVRFKDGLAVEHWSYMQPADVIKMLPPMPEAKMNNMRKEK